MTKTFKWFTKCVCVPCLIIFTVLGFMSYKEVNSI